ncbi:nucleotide exchange factor GrpE [Pelagibacterales bacterium]|nr:nucleotide exchange factor GrpE [Pelagibacterales bacterium]
MTKKKKSPVTEKAQNEELQEELQTEDKPEIIEPAVTEAEEINDLKNQLLRTLADNENNRRRYEKEKEDLSAYIISNFAKEMLSVLDNLQRAIEVSSKINTEDDKIDKNTLDFIEGVKLTEKQLNSINEKFKITKVDSLNNKFDPNMHQAMFEIENDDEEEGTILQVVQDGFKIEDRLLRPALVGVSKKKSK